MINPASYELELLDLTDGGMPGFTFRGIQANSTITLTAMVDWPKLSPVCFEIPCAKTSQGASPIEACTIIAIPIP